MLCVHPVVCVWCEGVLQPSLRTSLVSTGPSGAPSPVRSEFYKLSAHESGEYQTCPVLTWSRSVVRRRPLEFDARYLTWPTLEHRTQGVERPVLAW